MKNHLRKMLSCGILGLALSLPSTAQINYWKEVPAAFTTSAASSSPAIPYRYHSFELNHVFFRDFLFNDVGNEYNKAQTVTLPMPDGTYQDFRVWETPVMAADLSAKYPGIRTFTAEQVGNKFVTAKLDYGYHGFHAMVFDGDRTYVIDPVSKDDPTRYTVAYKYDFPRSEHFCASGELPEHLTDGSAVQLNHLQQRTNGITRKVYDLALACTGEYAAAVDGPSPTKPGVLSEMVLVVNRVNSVYERDLAVSLVMIDNENIIFLNGTTDPYTNNNGSTMLGQNIATLSDSIGNSNFDIGHVFSTGGGGVAYLSVICNNTYKAGGVTGLSNPVGDPFAIDYVAHEMGHQFGGPHTFNAETGSCSGNISTPDAYEPGSGSTIMAYAGICGSTNNLQPNSDPYFHSASLKNITNHINGSGGTCALQTTGGNTPNTYPSITATYSIPTFTPFELTAPAVADATADTLLYSWEEFDLGSPGTDWNLVNSAGPYFRSFNPATSNTRLFPSLGKILGNDLFSKGERLPAHARAYKFNLTVRDYYQGWGAFTSSDDLGLVTLNTVLTDTFQVTSQTGTETWETGETHTVTWDVASTNVAPINAANVVISFSADNGETFPYVAGIFPNTGSANITVPAGVPTTTEGRIKVKGENNVFFQINRAPLLINNTVTPITLADFTASAEGCDVVLKWTATGARNFSHFDVERSSDGRKFSRVSTVGYDENTTHYSSRAMNQGGSALFYYRLKMVDEDGSYSYSNLKKAAPQCDNDRAVTVSPNPVKAAALVTATAGIKRVQLVNVSGRVIRENVYSNAPVQININTEALAAGMYLINIECANGELYRTKLVKSE